MRKLQENESSFREELHERLENMVTDVNDVVSANVKPQTQNVSLETDEL